MRGHTIVLDVGKTLAKASLWTAAGELVDRRSRPNGRPVADGWAVLDVEGIEAWFADTCREFAAAGAVEAIVPVAHGAAVAVLREGALLCPPLDYEQDFDDGTRLAYEAERDPFALTGSPRLPLGLNLGAQLQALESRLGPLQAPQVTLLPWPQYWAWRLCGVAASEVTSLGCHSDLWMPGAGQPAPLAVRRGWAAALAPLRKADAVLGNLRAEWAQRTGLPGTVRVYCGLHDSNAALHATRSYPQLAGSACSIVSTGTWFIQLHLPADGDRRPELPQGRDCLLNVDVHGCAVPSSRFMGGREIEILSAGLPHRLDDAAAQAAIVAALPRVLAGGSPIRPTFAPGCGPFPDRHGTWAASPHDVSDRLAGIALYAALMTDAALALVGSHGNIVVEGRFAQAQAYTRALATLRADSKVYTAPAHDNIASGALRLVHPHLIPAGELQPVDRLPMDLTEWRARWRADAEEPNA